jgi:Xaa-Pro dipeptidase
MRESRSVPLRKLEALVEAMEREDLAALVFYSTGQLSMLEVNPVLWISGALPMGPHTAVLWTRAGQAALLSTLPWDLERLRRATWIPDVRSAKGFIGALAALLEEKGIAGPLGVVGGDFMPVGIHRGLAALRGIEARPADSILERLARSPGAGALPLLERAAEIADRGFSALLASARVGMPEHELAAEVEYAMRAAGAEDNFGMVSASPHSHGAHPPSDRPIEPGDILLAEITPAIGGHFVQLCRTAVMGRAPAELSEKFAILERALEESLALARPGRKAGELAKAMNRVFAERGYEKYCRPPYMRVRGHGLGFYSMPFPEIVDENEATIDAGTYFVIHPNQYLPETGYLMLGDTVWVEETGARRLTRTPARLFEIR